MIDVFLIIIDDAKAACVDCLRIIAILGVIIIVIPLLLWIAAFVYIGVQSGWKS